MIWLLFALFAILSLLRLPIAFSLGLSSIAVLFLTGFNLETAAERIFSGINNSTLIAIPGFILTGMLMLRGGISDRLLNCLNSWLGHFTGGLAIVTIATCAVFAAISGSSVATVAAIGSIMIPGLVKGGYDKDYAMGLVATAGILGILIPPSLSFIVFGSIAHASVADLFLGGVLPGVVLALTLMLTAVFYAKRKGIGKLPAASWATRWRSTRDAFWALMLPILIFVLIYGGIATPTEASVVTAAYAFIVAVYIYKGMGWKDIRRVLVETTHMTSMIYMIVSTATIFGMYLTISQTPQALVQWLIDLNVNVYMFLLGVNILFLILGAFLDSVSILLITIPILLPAIKLFNLNLYHFAVITIVNLELGMLTPPVGLNLFVAGGIANEPLERVIKAVIPFIGVMFFVLFLVIVFPELSLALIPGRK